MTTINMPDGDLPAAGITLIDGQESVRQRVRQRIRLHRGECYYDTSAGVPYRRDFLGQRETFLQTHLIASEIRKVDGVEEVLSLQTEPATPGRKLTIEAEIAAEGQRQPVSEEI